MKNIILFKKKRDNIQTCVNDFKKQMDEQLKNFSFTCLENYLSPRFASTNKTKEKTCINCGFNFKSIKGLNGHLKSCKIKKIDKEESIDSS